MQIVVTMGGQSRRFAEQGILQHKAIVQAGPRIVLDYLVYPFVKHDIKINFVINNQFQNTNIEAVINCLAKKNQFDFKIIYCDYSDRGPIDTLYAALPYLDRSKSILTMYCDLALCFKYSEFVKQLAEFDMASLNYQRFHPTYLGKNSYCHVKTKDIISGGKSISEVVEFKEKEMFGSNLYQEITSAGVYYFKDLDLLKEGLQQQESQNLKYKNEFYTSMALQALLNKNSTCVAENNLNNNIRVLDYRIDHVVQFGTPFDVELFQFMYKKIVLEKFDFNKEILIFENLNLTLNQETYDLLVKYWFEVFRYYKFI